MSNFNFSIDLPVRSEWSNVDLLRTSVQNCFTAVFSDIDGCQALAMVSGRDFVIPEDIKRLASPVLSHRILMKDRRLTRGDFSPESRFIQKILSEIPVPR